jgi:hypothetical protein
MGARSYGRGGGAERDTPGRHSPRPETAPVDELRIAYSSGEIRTLALAFRAQLRDLQSTGMKLDQAIETVVVRAIEAGRRYEHRQRRSWWRRWLRRTA